MISRLFKTSATPAVNSRETRCKLVARKARFLLFVVAVGMVTGCKNPLEIFGEGDIYSASGLHDCTLEEFNAGPGNQCITNEVTGDFNEVYQAVPRSGWHFKGWRTYCAYNSLDDTCSFDISASTVASYTSAPALRAEFVEDCAEGEVCIEALAPQLGAVTDSSIKIWQVTRGDANFVVRYKTGTDPWSSTAPTIIDDSTGWVGTVPLTGLEPNTAYEYETWLNGVLHTSATFSTLPLSTSKAPLHFGFGTDFIHYYHPFTALSAAAEKGFDFMLLIGDLIYADFEPAVDNTIDSYAERYWLTWNEANFASLGLSTPLFMMWDDHEIDNDFYPGMHIVTGTADRYPAAREAYDLYMGSHNPDTAPDPSPPPGITGDVLYYSFSAPGADFFVLDTRSYRSPNNAPDDSSKSMLGAEQRNALLAFLGQSTAAFKFIVTTVPFALGEDSGDTWNAFQNERELILSGIEGIPGVLFLSGDRHWSGAFRFISSGGYAYYDFLPSPTGAFLRSGTAPDINTDPNETIIYTAETYQAFGDFQIDLSGETPTLRAAFVDENGNDRCVITIRNDETGVLGAGPVATCLAPGTPVLSVSGKTSTQITLAWDDVTAETGYSLRRSTSANAVLDPASEIVLLGADVTGYTDSNLAPNTTYYYQLVAVNDTAESASAVISAKTLRTPGC